MKKTIRVLGIAVTIVLSCSGCGRAFTELVPAGFKGQVKQVSGWTGEIIAPGWTQCWGRDALWLVETRTITKETGDMEVLLKEEQVNFKVNVAVTFTLKGANADIKPVFDKVKPNSQRVIDLDAVYKVYAAPILSSIPKQIIRGYTSDLILKEETADEVTGKASPTLESKIDSAIRAALKDTPIEIVRIAIKNLDFTGDVTKRQEEAMEAKIAVQQADFNNRIKQLEAENRVKIKTIQNQVAARQADAIADSNKLMGEALEGEAGEAYLRWKEKKVYGEAARGQNRCLFMPMTIIGGSSGSGMGHEAAMTIPREELRKVLVATLPETVAVEETAKPTPTPGKKPKG